MTNLLTHILPLFAFTRPVNSITWTHAVSSGRSPGGAICLENRKTIELMRESDV